MEYLWSHLCLRKFCHCRNNTFGTIQRDLHEPIRLKLDICIFWPSKFWPTPKQLAKNTKKCAINSFSKLKMIPQNWMISTSRLATIKVVGFGCLQLYKEMESTMWYPRMSFMLNNIPNFNILSYLVAVFDLNLNFSNFPKIGRIQTPPLHVTKLWLFAILTQKVHHILNLVFLPNWLPSNCRYINCE